MRAIVVTAPAPSDNISLVERPDPVASPHQVSIDVTYCGCNFADTMLRKGTYPHPVNYPIVPGFELSGTIAAVGDEVDGFAVGDRVAGFIEPGGTYAERCVTEPERLIKLPDAVALDAGAAFPLQGMTAWHMLHTVARIEAGATVLVHAIGGGVGLYVTQIARKAGCTVIGTVSSEAKAAKPLHYGAARVINRTEEDFVAEVDRLTDGRGVDLVIDSLGAETLDRSFACVRKLGHVISIGEAEGEPYKNIRERILPKSLSFTRFHLGHAEPDPNRRAAAALLDGLVSGWLEAPIANIFGIEQALDMQLSLESGKVPGKLLLKIAA